jgi:hypothetical protein
MRILLMADEHIIDEETVFNAALAIGDADERAAYLHNACGGDARRIGRINDVPV